MAEPAAMQPKKTISEIARPRARTQLGSAVWAETLRLVSTVIQPRPQRTAPGRAEAVLVASPSAAIAAATDRKSVVKGKRVSVRVDLGGRSIITKKKNNK